MGVVTFLLLSESYPFLKDVDDWEDESKREDLKNARFDFGPECDPTGLAAVLNTNPTDISRSTLTVVSTSADAYFTLLIMDIDGKGFIAKEDLKKLLGTNSCFVIVHMISHKML